MTSASNHSRPEIETIGESRSKIPVEIGVRFLKQFSEHLYSSPQKAFEELISNGWDAGATRVDVYISPDAKTNGNATLAVLDNGISMDESGLRQLWRVAFSPKEGKSEERGRTLIGKFGIGKLSTYVLGNRLTYICKAADGKIRRVTMDYAAIDARMVSDGDEDKLLNKLELDVFELTENDVEVALQSTHGGSELWKLINGKRESAVTAVLEDEYGGVAGSLEPSNANTWTLAVLSGLKKPGKELKIGVLKRMLAAALPFGSQMLITVNGNALASPKLDLPRIKEWVIGPDLDISSVEIESSDSADEPKTTEEIKFSSASEPVPHINIPGIGMVTGRVVLFADPVAGGKSEERGSSNGFHINVVGRLVNQDSPTFGANSLNHAAWSRFRMTVRADGLNKFLTTDRERFSEAPELGYFRAFLHRAFNRARSAYDSDENSLLPDGGDVLVQSLGVLSLNPLRSVVDNSLATQPPLPFLIDETGVKDREEARQKWKNSTTDNIRNALDKVKFERMSDDSFVKFRIADNCIVVNTAHPFTSEHSHTRAEKELMRTIGMVSLLSDMFALEVGIAPDVLETVREYRDRLLRYRAIRRRQSGTHIAALLLKTGHDSANSKRLEAAVSGALRYLGYDIEDLAQAGEPEGIARAYPIPTRGTPTAGKPTPLYSFTFDAKSSKGDNAQTGNIKLDAAVEHRERYNADHALIVAPGYSDGAIATRCEQQKVTPLTTVDLGKLLEYTVQYGAIPLNVMKEMLEIYNPEKVSAWVASLAERLKVSRPLTISLFLEALTHLKGQIPDGLSASTIAYVCREKLGVSVIKNEDVIALAKGLAILVPDLVGVEGDKIVVNASPTRVASAIATQLEGLRDPNHE